MIDAVLILSTSASPHPDSSSLVLQVAIKDVRTQVVAGTNYCKCHGMLEPVHNVPAYVHTVPPVSCSAFADLTLTVRVSAADTALSQGCHSLVQPSSRLQHRLLSAHDCFHHLHLPEALSMSSTHTGLKWPGV
jgi:hypothetical protein